MRKINFKLNTLIQQKIKHKQSLYHKKLINKFKLIYFI